MIYNLMTECLNFLKGIVVFFLQKVVKFLHCNEVKRLLFAFIPSLEFNVGFIFIQLCFNY